MVGFAQKITLHGLVVCVKLIKIQTDRKNVLSLQ